MLQPVAEPPQAEAGRLVSVKLVAEPGSVVTVPPAVVDEVVRTMRIAACGPAGLRHVSRTCALPRSNEGAVTEAAARRSVTTSGRVTTVMVRGAE